VGVQQVADGRGVLVARRGHEHAHPRPAAVDDDLAEPHRVAGGVVGQREAAPHAGTPLLGHHVAGRLAAASGEVLDGPAQLCRRRLGEAGCARLLRAPEVGA
jgi:hypothetical protein